MSKRGVIKAGVVTWGLVVSLWGCDYDLTGLNDNPNAPTQVGDEFLLPQSMQQAVDVVFDESLMLLHTEIWPQHVAEIQFPLEEVGEVQAARMETYWSTLYSGALTDVQTVIDQGRAQGLVNHEAIGLIWRSWIFHVITDLWGDVPYSEALRGADDITPAYDAQQDIYAGLISDLTTAVGLLDAAARGFDPAGADLIYGSDVAAWTRFANSLRMRLAMRLAEVDPTTAQTEVAAAWAAGPFASNADNAALAWPGSPYDNPLFEDWQLRDDHGVSATLVDTLTSLSDPRLELYAEPAASDGLYRGWQNGLDSVPVTNTISRIGNYWRADGQATPTLLMSYSEVLFLAAEAAERGWLPGENAAALYTQAITANMEQYQGMAANAPTGAEITTYLAQPGIAYAGGSAGLAQIYLQQWIGLYMNGLEAWSLVRRTGTPSLTPGADLAAAIGGIPVRLRYPPSEQSLNGASYSVAVARQGPDDLLTRIWWDVN